MLRQHLLFWYCEDLVVHTCLSKRHLHTRLSDRVSDARRCVPVARGHAKTIQRLAAPRSGSVCVSHQHCSIVSCPPPPSVFSPTLLSCASQGEPGRFVYSLSKRQCHNGGYLLSRLDYNRNMEMQAEHRRQRCAEIQVKVSCKQSCCFTSNNLFILRDENEFCITH